MTTWQITNFLNFGLDFSHSNIPRSTTYEEKGNFLWGDNLVVRSKPTVYYIDYAYSGDVT